MSTIILKKLFLFKNETEKIQIQQIHLKGVWAGAGRAPDIEPEEHCQTLS